MKNWINKIITAAAAILLTASAAQSAELTVDTAYGDTTSGWGATAFATIQAAVTAADDGDTINVAAGTYTEQLSVDKSIALVGVGSDSTLIQPAAGLNAIDLTTSGSAGNVCALTLDGVGLIVSGAGKGINAGNLSYVSITLDDSVINYGEASIGILLGTPGSGGSGSHNAIALANSRIECVATSASSYSKGIGWYYSSESTLDVTDSTITSGHYAIRLDCPGLVANIHGSTLTGYAAFNLNNTDSTINIDECTLTGRTFWPSSDGNNDYGTLVMQDGAVRTTVNVTHSTIANEFVGAGATSYETLILSTATGSQPAGDRNNKVYLDAATVLTNANRTYAPSDVQLCGIGDHWYIDGVEQANPLSPGQTILYVSTTGSDANDGLMPTTAKLTIQAAVTAAPVGYTIQIAPGTYTAAVTSVPRTVTLVGAGPAETILLPAAGSNAITMDTSGSSGDVLGLTLKDIGLTVSGAGRGIQMGDLSYTSLVLDNTTVNYGEIGRGISFGFADSGNSNNVISLLNSRLLCAATGSSSMANRGISFYHSANSILNITDSTVTAGHYALTLNSPGLVANIDGSTLTGFAALNLHNTGSTINVVNSTLTGRTFWSPISNNYGAVAFDSAINTRVNLTGSTLVNEWAGTGTSYESLIQDCCNSGNTAYLDSTTVLNNTNRDYAPYSVRGNLKWYIDGVEQSIATNPDKYVNDSIGDDSNSGDYPALAKKTIKAAINAAVPGDTIKVAAGTYAEVGQIVIDKDLTIAGAGMASTIFNATGDTASSGDLRGWWFVQAGVNLELSGMTLDGNGYLIFQGIRHLGLGSIDDVAFANILYGDYGGFAVGAGNGGIGDLDITNSSFTNIGRVGVLYYGTGGLFSGNTYTGKGVGDWLDYALDIGAGANVVVSDNLITGCSGIASSDDSVSCGVLVSDLYGSGTAAEITGNTITGNLNGIMVGYNDTDASIANASMNDLSGNGTAFSSKPATIVDGSLNWFGAEDPDFVALVDGPVEVSPWWADEAMTLLKYADDSTIAEDMTVDPGETVIVGGTMSVSNGATVTVNNGTLCADSLDLVAGAALVVINGELELTGANGQPAILAGSFTIFDSWGSIYFDANAELEGDTIALVSHLVFADGVELAVSGGLTLDGCVLEAEENGSYSVVVSNSASLTMVRNEVLDCSSFAVATGDALIKDNLFENGLIVTEEADGAEVFHNIFTDEADLTDNGANTVLASDGWDNLSAGEVTTNNLGLTLADADAEGNVYIQPGDALAVSLDLSDLNVPVSGVDALMGFDTLFLGDTGTVTVTDGAAWTFDIYESLGLGDATYGQIDKSIGVDVISIEGTTDDSTVLGLDFTTTDEEGVTKVFFRVGADGDVPADTRLTSAPDGNPVYVSPFTMNSGYVTIDGTAPVSSLFMGFQDQGSGDVDVFDPAVLTQQGIVYITIDATDELSGLAGSTLTLVNQGPDANILLPTLTSSHTEGELDASYSWALVVDAATPNGIYDVELVVSDRSGNTTTNTATIEVNKTQVALNVELTGAIAGTFSRDVTLVMTDAGSAVMGIRVETLEFIGGVATLSMLQVPAGVAAISADTDWTLRSRQTLVYDGDGQTSAALVLTGGDLNNDNIVDMLDFARLRYFYNLETPEADIDGDGWVNMTDYGLLQYNWYLSGDAE
ncbi:dockerin type I domain-containing protein [Pontiella sulfatireligans]|uniref:Pectate lyase C n=1 Tax=Pontiella sulfatireligans TaxID=2750658 RepID=A0A6C2USK8_9BACT|nr:dockerin type I domain-containing protein [Pontiella sulfatireligans]VGO22241.1 hypothetical protein SCARR_04323 [Pontiella sulfatireligans]